LAGRCGRCWREWLLGWRCGMCGDIWWCCASRIWRRWRGGGF